MQCSIPSGKSMPLPGGTLSLHYTVPVNANWSVLVGISGGYYGTKVKLNDGAVFTSGQVDDQGAGFQYKVRTTGYEETQHFGMASIPLMAQYHSDGDKGQWYVNAGVKLCMAYSVDVDAKAKQLDLSGYYPDYDLEVKDMPQHGLGTANNWKAKTTLDPQFSVAGSVAGGRSWGFGEIMRLYVGLFVDYGLTPMYKKDGSSSVVSYSASGVQNIRANSAMNMEGSGNPRLFAFGAQVKLGLKYKQQAKPAAKK